MSQKPPKKKKFDPYKGLKFFAFRMAQLPQPFSGKDLVRYAKMHLAIKTHTLLKDPIWDLYTNEELLVEFFAWQFQDEKIRDMFEQDLGDIDGSVDEFAKWADKEMAEEAKVRAKTLNSMEDRVSFDPGMIMGEEE